MLVREVCPSAWAQLGSEKGCHMAGATAIALLGQPGEVLHSQKSQNYIIIYKYISINIIYIYIILSLEPMKY